eukprot:1093392_1
MWFILIFVACCSSQLQQLQRDLKSVELTASQSSQQGATVQSASSEVTTTATQWNITGNSDTTWHLTTELDNTWGFDPNRVSTITIKFNSQTPVGPQTYQNVVVAFSVPTIDKYIALALRMDPSGNAKNNIVPPNGNTCPSDGSLALVNGDVVDVLANNGSGTRSDKLGLEEATASKFVPSSHGQQVLPIQFTLENHPMNNSVVFTYDGFDVTANESLTQQCVFEALDINKGLSIYFAVNRADNLMAMDSILLTYRVVPLLATGHVYNETTVLNLGVPTQSPSVPTQIPTYHPTYGPTTQPTRTPTELPSVQPTTLPTHSPTELPTELPSAQPTTRPTHGTASPSRPPSAQPTNPPTVFPSVAPTELPTVQPTRSPSLTDYCVPELHHIASWSTSYLSIEVRMRNTNARLQIQPASKWMDCHDIFDHDTNTLMEHATCSVKIQEINDLLFVIDLASTSTIGLNSVITIQKTTIQFMCSGTNDGLRNLDDDVVQSSISQPLDRSVPNIILSKMSTAIGVCDELILDARSTTNLGGRTGLFEWQISIAGTHHMYHYIGSYVVIGSDSLLKDKTYTIEGNVTNWYEAMSTTVFVVYVSNEATPSVSIQGITEYTTTDLNLNGWVDIAATVTFDDSCLNNLNNVELTYDISWSAQQHRVNENDAIIVDEDKFLKLGEFLQLQREEEVSVEALELLQSGFVYTFSINVQCTGAYECNVNAVHQVTFDTASIRCMIVTNDIALDK